MPDACLLISPSRRLIWWLSLLSMCFDSFSVFYTVSNFSFDYFSVTMHLIIQEKVKTILS